MRKPIGLVLALIAMGCTSNEDNGNYPGPGPGPSGPAR